MPSIYDFKVKDKADQEHDLAQYKGKVVLVVNTASKCGFTPQFDGLEKLYQKYKDRGFVILGFPCNQFGSQDPGSQDEIESFCKVNYGVTFPIMKKIEVNGDNAEPFWEFLKKEKAGIMGLKRIKWNFEKFLIDANGNVAERYASITTPESIESTVEKLLPAQPSL
ncbi:glutathione peroxidase [Conidiobolus coronatus NRRL 28638]|uniref:Glutathione peroxidase n=1 Tax=Conidiobolus coronatus (strain ATCC 28846 / CBS 209.66 / NRRL 28638) TaxID=796925 RepID=A0A137PAL9_CONC2|nr:glutathione peroxidase [Conidiobolus coronatus NRRL 28638]|eukprot:KXN72004.1 glutathione peroxidase [Conidiobolus coronatus NRRL 28638]